MINYRPYLIDLNVKIKQHLNGFVLNSQKNFKTLSLKVYSFLKNHKLFIGVTILMLIVPLFVRTMVWQMAAFEPEISYYDEKEMELKKQNLNREISTLNKKLQTKRPKSYFLVINSGSNEFVLYNGTEMVKKDKCSTGSYILLKNGDKQQWMFKTPKGEFSIQYKTKSPVWKKPDWAFVEEGLPVPATNHYTRFEYGVLGDYALSLGDGYLIHGTLYQRFLGLPVTHGCIRLNDKNLELVYKSLQIGSKVYIY